MGLVPIFLDGGLIPAVAGLAGLCLDFLRGSSPPMRGLREHGASIRRPPGVYPRAGRVEVRLSFEADHIRLSVSHDGVGLPDDYAERGHGFDGMRTDAERMGGRLIVESGAGRCGTTIACVVPCETDQADQRGG